MSLENLRPTATAFVNRSMPGTSQQGMINNPYQSMFQTPYGNYNPYGSPVQELPKSYQDLTDVRFTSRGGQTGRGEEFLSNFVGNTEGDQLTLRRRLQRAMDQGLLSYADPLPTAQPQQGMFSPYMMPQMPQMPFDVGGVNYPQFNLGYNPYLGMFNPFMAYGSPYGSNF